MNRRTRFPISILVSLSLLIACIVFVPYRTDAAQKEFKYSTVDEQTAVNLTPAQLEEWAYAKGYTITKELLSTDNGQVLAYTVTHRDTAGEIYKKLAAAGKAAIKKYVEGVDTALNMLPKDIVLGNIDLDAKSIAGHVNEQGIEGVESVEGIYAITDSVIAAGKKGELLVTSRYFYDSLDTPARFGQIIKSKAGHRRGYGLLQFGRDILHGQTKDGYSVKKDKYYYKQDTVTINGDNYWQITVKPY